LVDVSTVDSGGAGGRGASLEEGAFGTATGAVGNGGTLGSGDTDGADGVGGTVGGWVDEEPTGTLRSAAGAMGVDGGGLTWGPLGVFAWPADTLCATCRPR